jgi:hypothetical protein
MYRIAAIGAPLLAASVLLPATAIAAGTSHASVWQNKAKTVECGITANVISRKDMLCSAKGIPRPKHSNPNVGDPFVQLAKTGKAKLVLISQNSFPAKAKVHTLATGTTWSSRGMTCTIGAKSVTCKNGSHHGFTIGNGHYKAF